MRFTPSGGNICKSQLYFLEILETLLLFCAKTGMEMQLVILREVNHEVSCSRWWYQCFIEWVEANGPNRWPRPGVCGWARCRCGASWWPQPCRWPGGRRSQWGRAAGCPGPRTPPRASGSSPRSPHWPPQGKKKQTWFSMEFQSFSFKVEFKKKKKKKKTEWFSTDFDKSVADDLPLLLRAGGHVERLADALAWCPVLLGDGEGRRAIVERVSCVHHCKDRRKKRKVWGKAPFSWPQRYFYGRKLGPHEKKKCFLVSISRLKLRFCE